MVDHSRLCIGGAWVPRESGATFEARSPRRQLQRVVRKP